MSLEVVEVNGLLEIVETFLPVAVVEVAPVGTPGPPGAIGPTGPAGPQGVPGQGAANSYAFAWGDVSPGSLALIAANQTVLKVEVLISTPFDVQSSMSIGDSADNGRLLSTDAVDLSASGVYQVNPGHKYTSETQIYFYLSLGSGAAAGAGLILVYIQT